jgi:hypothetical protein
MDAGPLLLRDRLVRWLTTLQRARLTGREQEALRRLDALDDEGLRRQEEAAAARALVTCGRQAQGPRGPWCLYEGEDRCDVHCPHRDFDPGEGPIAFG